MCDENKLEQIISGCKKGKNECFTQLLEIYANRCYGYFYRLTGNRSDSDDLLSELFIKLVTKIDSFKGGSFDGWLFTVASNLFYDHLRRKKLEN